MKSSTERVLREGTFAGVIVYATVALYFLVANVLTGRPAFETAAKLGGAILAGVREPAQVVLEPAWILGFNGIHLGASLVLGMVGSAVVLLLDRHPFAWYGLFYLIVASFILSLALLGVLTVELAGAIGWGSLVGSHVAGGVLGWAYLAYAHREELSARARMRSPRPG